MSTFRFVIYEEKKTWVFDKFLGSKEIAMDYAEYLLDKYDALKVEANIAVTAYEPIGMIEK